MVILELPFVVADARELHTYIRVCQYTYAHLSNGDRLATLDMFPLMGIDLFKMPTSPMGINWCCILIDAHLSDGDQLVMLDVLEIDLFKFIKIGTIITKMNSIKQTKKAIFLVRVDWEEQVHVLWCTEIERFPIQPNWKSIEAV
ncbi:hypothetical protein EMCRGX_G009493 [Ephydatia muelleri]